VKERLTGAIILVALIVLLVPELLTGPVRSAPRPAVVAAASAEEPPLRSYTIHLADDGHGHSATTTASDAEQPAPLPAPAEAPPAAGSAVTVPPQAPSPAPTESHAATPGNIPDGAGSAHAPANAPTPAASGGGFVVQLGSFASHANAEHLAQQLRAQGYKVSVSQADSGRHLYRVRVGPARDHDAALQLNQRLRSIGHGGSIVPK
jgi:DedD protein